MNRRQVLASAGSALTLGVAGCLDSGPLSGVFGGSGEGVQYDQWLPAPATFGYDDEAGGGYGTPFRFLDVDTLDSVSNEGVEQRLDAAALPGTDALLSRAGLALRDLDYLVNAQMLFSVAHGEFDVDALGDELAAQGFARESGDDGPAIYTVEDQGGSTAGIGLTEDVIATAGTGEIVDGELVVGGLEEPVSAVRGVFEAGDGDAERYGAADPHVETLIDHLDEGDAGFGDRRPAAETDREAGEFAGQEAWGASFAVDGDATEFSEVFVFGADAEPPTGEIEAWLDADHPHQWGRDTEPSDYSVDEDGDAVVVRGEFPTAEGFLLA